MIKDSSQLFLLTKICKRYPIGIAFAILLGFAAAIFNGVSIALIIPLIAQILGENSSTGLNLPGIFKPIFTLLGHFPDRYHGQLILISIVVLIAAKNAANYISMLASGKIQRRVASDLRKEALQLLLNVNLAYFHKSKIGDLVSYVNTETGRVASAIKQLLQIVILAITALVFVGLLISLSWQLTLASSFIMLLVLLFNDYFSRKAKVLGKQLSQKSREMSSHFIETLSGIRLVKLSCQESTAYETGEHLIDAYESAALKSQNIFAAIAPINEMSSVISIIFLIGLGRVFFYDQSQIYSALILTYLVLLSRLTPILSSLSSGRSQIANFSTSVEIVESLLSRAGKSFMKSGTRPFLGVQDSIHFQEVSFRYGDDKNWVLNDINLQVDQGQMLAIVGASGAGKSTLADLLPRLYDPQAGTIYIDGVDIREFDLDSYRRKIGVVSQDTFLFNTSVKANIRYANPDATDAEIYQAAVRANALEFIQKLPQGFETIIGDRGVTLSGGQRQRLAIARVILQNPEILILDEATSALDTFSEKAIQKSIEELSHNRTTLIIAHRLSTIMNADKIAVMRSGKVVELGTHLELLEKKGVYQQLCAVQFSESAGTDAAALPMLQLSKQQSHQLRTDMNAVLGSLDILSAGFFDNQEEKIQIQDEAHHSAIRIAKLFESLTALK